MPRTPRARLALLLALPLAAACREDEADRLFELRSPRETGIRFANALREDDSVHNALAFDYLYNGGGVAVGDVNGDGRPDVYLTGNMVSSRLYLNEGALRFEDVTETAGVGTSVWATGVTMVDVDQDGRLDLYVSVAGPGAEATRANLLFHNEGNDAEGVPRFVECAADYGLADTGYSTQAAFLDYDRDGDLDAYLLTNALERFNRNNIRPRLVNGAAPSTDRLYRNDGGRFTDVSREAGILVEGYGLGVAVSDLDRDGWPDIYVANDFISNDLVWINGRDGTFTNRAASYLKHQTYNGMGTDVADYDNDGLVDIVVLDMLPPDNRRQKMMLQGGNYDRFHMGLRVGYEPQYMRNTLQRNLGAGPDGHPVFAEIGQLAGVHETDWSWAPLFADFDNDGWKDLFITNGYRRDVTNLDYVVYLQEGSTGGPEPERRRMLLEGLRGLPEVPLANYGFRNEGNLTFSDRSREWGLDLAGFSNGAAYADLDADGDLDLVINNIDAPASVYENTSDRVAGRNWLRLALVGAPGNAGGHGASATVFAGGARQFLELYPTRGYVSAVEPVLHFGLGAAARADSVVVRWPDGSCQRLAGVAANQLLTVRRSAAGGPCPEPAPAADARLFRPASVPGLEIAHEAREVPDFKVTPLIPRKYSQGGPAIAIGDADGDGRDDVYVGADRGVEKGILLQTAPGRFTRRALAGARDFHDMGALFVDADGDGDEDLLVANGGSFLTRDSAVYRARLYVNDGRANFRLAADALPPTQTSGSSVVAADYDADGDLDVFVGGRVRPGTYPLPPRSYLLRNDTPRGGAPRFTDATETAAPGLAEVGLVTSALWTDVDADARLDLLVVGEWMPITLFRNAGGGRLEDATAATALGATGGWWNSLAGGDFDADGDTDYLVGNFGLNSRYQTPSESQPVRVHAADFDGNGSIDPVVSRYIDGTSYPVASRDQMIDQMVGMKGRFPRYAAFADATLDETLTAEERAGATVLTSTTLASAYLENLGGGRLRRHVLPLPVQTAPIFGMLPRDHDGDGDLDVLLVGNSHAEETQGGWQDAFVGAALLGDGRGGFRHASGTESGFFVDGDAKAIAELALDERRSLVLVAQNDDSLRAFAPARERAGVRLLRVQPLDVRAEITLADGRTRGVELHHGSTYLSQSSRRLAVPDDAVRVVVHDSRGRARTVLGGR